MSDEFFEQVGTERDQIVRRLQSIVEDPEQIDWARRIAVRMIEDPSLLTRDEWTAFERAPADEISNVMIRLGIIERFYRDRLF